MPLMQNTTFSLKYIFVDLRLLYAMDMSHSTIRRAVRLSFTVAAVVEKLVGDEDEGDYC